MTNLIHSTAIVYDGVELGDNVIVEAHCILGNEFGGRLSIGSGSVIRSHSIVERGFFGDRLETGHFVLIRDGHAGENLRIGSYSSLEGDVTIGDYVRIHGRCEATLVNLQDFSRVYGGSYLTDVRMPPLDLKAPATVEPGAVLCMGVILIAGVTVGLGAYVGASTVVARDVPPATVLLRDGRRKSITDLSIDGLQMPWTGHTRADYPPEAWGRLDELRERILAAIAASHSGVYEIKDSGV